MSLSNSDNALKHYNNATGNKNNRIYEVSGSTPRRDAIVNRTINDAKSITPVNMNLRSIEEIPERYRVVFDKYRNFNVIQSKVFNDVFYTDEPLAISAPTGSGKTVIFELAIVKLLQSLEQSRFKRDYKIVYISPTKALCEERLMDWHKKFSNFDVTCVSVTGDSSEVDCSFLLNSNIIITTPEKWDSLTRRWRNCRKLVHAIKLFMIDEIHLLNEERRGPTLEAVVSRMKTIQDCIISFPSKDGDVPDKIRFIAASATIPNISDIAEWLGSSTKAALFYKFHEDMRPVKLQKVVLGYPYNPSMSSFFKFDIMLCYKLQNILLQYAEGKPTLIFCSTRKSVEFTAKHISLNLTINLNCQQKQALVGVANMISDGKVRDLLVHGVGYHHAGLLPENRKVIENTFRDGNLPILVTTSTLAMGVNLPAHLVIIKSTKYYADGEYKDYSESVLCQMIGRAGRPQFDTSATAVILTTANDKSKYQNMVEGSQMVESRLHKHLVEHLNAEVVLRTITDLGVAMQWLTATFLYIRARKNPKCYGLTQGLTLEQLDKKLLDICQIEINKLSKAGMLTIDSNVLITPTVTGTLMAKNCLALETMKLFTQVTGKEPLQHILSLITKCHEYSEIYLRTTDKKALNLLNNCRGRETIRFKLNGKIKTLDMKINCIIQAVLGCLEIMESSLIVEAQKIIRIAERVLNCLAEYLEGKPDCFSGLLNTLILLKCCRARIWENSSFVSRQLHGIGVALSNALVAAEKTSFEAILNSNPRDIERIIGRKPPTGDKIKEQIKYLPKYKLVIKETMTNEDVKVIEVTVTLENASDLSHAITVDTEGVMNFLIGDDDNNIIVYEKYTHSYTIENPVISKSIRVAFKEDRTISAFFISDSWVGFDANASIVLFPVDEANKQKLAKNTVQEKMKKKSGSYTQHVIDTYFKKKKPISKGSNAKSVKLKKGNKKEDSPISSKACEIEEAQEEIGENKESSNGKENAEVEIKNSENNVENNEARDIAQVAESNAEKDVTANENFTSFSNEESTTENKTKETQDVEKMLENQANLFIETRAFQNKVSAFGQVTVKQIIKAREKERQSLHMFEFENMVHNIAIPERKNLCKTESEQTDNLRQTDSAREDDFRRTDSPQTGNNDAKKLIQAFVISPKKQIHTEIETDKNLCSVSPRKRKLDDFIENGYSVHFENKYEIKSIIKDSKCIENGAKSLTWSSPLVTSPAVKFSPKFKYKRPIQNTSQDVSLISPDTLKITEYEFRPANNVPIFPLSDKAWSELTTQETNSSNGAEKQVQIDDVVSLECFGFSEKKEENSVQLKSTPSQAGSKLNQSKEINSGDYYFEKLRPMKVLSKFPYIKDFKKEEAQNTPNASNLEKSKINSSVSTDPQFSEAQVTQAKSQKISVVGKTASNYFDFVPFCEENSEPENKINSASQKANFYTQEKEEMSDIDDSKYSWENEFLENDFDEVMLGIDSDEQSLPESIKLCKSDNDANTRWESLVKRDTFNECQYQDDQRLLRDYGENSYFRTYHPEDHNSKPASSRDEYVNTGPEDFCNNTQSVSPYNERQRAPTYFCAEPEDHHSKPASTRDEYVNTIPEDFWNNTQSVSPYNGRQSTPTYFCAEPEDHHSKPASSRDEYINTGPEDFWNNTQSVLPYNKRQSIEVKPTYFCAEPKEEGFYRCENRPPTQTQNYFNTDTNVFHRQSLGCRCCNNQHNYETQSFAEQMRAMTPSRNVDRHPIIHHQNQNFMNSRSYNPRNDYIFSQQSVGSSRGHRLNYAEYDDPAGTNYYMNQRHQDTGIRQYLAPSYHSNNFERVPLAEPVADRSFLMDKYFNSHDLNKHGYLTPGTREMNPRFVNRNKPDYMRYNHM